MRVTKHLKGPTRNDTTAKMTARELSLDGRRSIKECNRDGDLSDDHRERTVEHLINDENAGADRSIEREPMSKCKKKTPEELRSVLLRPANKPSSVREHTSFDYRKEFIAELVDNKKTSPESPGLAGYQKKSPVEIGDHRTLIKDSSPERIPEASYQRNPIGETMDGIGSSKVASHEPSAITTNTTTTTTTTTTSTNSTTTTSTTTPTFKKKGLTRRETFEERCRQILGMEDYGDTQGSYTHEKGRGVEHEFTVRIENLSDDDMDRSEEATKSHKAEPLKVQASVERMTTTQPNGQCVDNAKGDENTRSFEDAPRTDDLKQINDATLYNTEIVIQQVHGPVKDTPRRLPADAAQKPINSSVSDVSRTSSPERKPAPAKASPPKKRDIVAAVHLCDEGGRKASRPSTEDTSTSMGTSMSTSQRKPIKDQAGPRVIQTRSVTKARGETRTSKTLANNGSGPRRESNPRPMPFEGNRPRRFSKEKVVGREKPLGEGARRPTSSPDGSPPPSLERRRSSNISVHTEIVIDHTRPRTPKDEGCRPGAKTDDDNRDSALLERQHKKLSVTERKESAPVRRVTREDKDAKMMRSTSENTFRGAARTPKAATATGTATPGCLSPSGRRPSKCLTTKSINLTAVDRVMRSDDMESVVIDIQRAKSSREPSPNKIVPTPVSDDVDVGRPRYPDIIQEPDDELRRRPVVTNVPIFEEDTNERIGCHIVEINTKDFTQDGDRYGYIADMPSSPTVEAPKSLDDETLDDVCLLSVQDKVSKFTHSIEKQKQAGRPSVDAIVNRSPPLSRNNRTEKISTVTDDVLSATFRVDDNVARIAHHDHDNSPGARRPTTTNTTTTTTTKGPEKLVAAAPQKSPELVAKIERQISRQNEPDSSHRSVKVPDSPKTGHDFAPNYDDADELMPFSKTHSTSMELRRQRDILARPSVFGNKRQPRPDAKDEDFVQRETEMNIKTSASVFKAEASNARIHSDDDRADVNDDDDRSNYIDITETICETVDTTTTNESAGTVFHQTRPNIEDRDARYAHVNGENVVQGHGGVAVRDSVRLASVTPGQLADGATRYAPNSPDANMKVADACTVGPPLQSSHRSSKSVTTKTTEHVVVHPSCSSPCSQETELILDAATKTNTSKDGAPRREPLTETVAARRNLFERGRGSSPPRSNNAKASSTYGPGPMSSAPIRRPSYMEHTRSSLEHTRRDSLEINKSSYARRTTPDDENIGVERKLNTTVKFDIPQQQQQQQQKYRNVENRRRDDIDIETIFDLSRLEEMLETVTAYELRRRIRAQIRLVKKNKQNVNTSSRPPRERSISPIPNPNPSLSPSPSPIASSKCTRELEMSEVATDRTEMREKAMINIEDLPDTHDVVPSDVDDDVARSQENEKVHVTTKSVMKTSQHLSKVSNNSNQNKNTVQPKENKAPIWADRKNILRKTSMKAPPPGKAFTASASSKTTSATSERRRQESDSIISSYGIGPTDENGLPLFGIKALRKKSQPSRPSEAKEEFTEHVVEERRYYSDGQMKPMVERKETIVSSNGGIVKKMETKSKGRASPEKDLLTANKCYMKSGAELKEATQQRDLSVSSSTSKSSKYMKCGSVKEMSEKFIRKESSKTLAEKHCGAYPKAGLILRANSRSGIMDENGRETTAGGRAPLHATGSGDDNDDDDNDDDDEEYDDGEEVDDDVNEEEEEEYSYEMRHTTSRAQTEVDNADVGENAIVNRGQRQGGQKSSTRSFLNSSNETRMVTNLDDALERMRNADNVMEVGDSAEDQEARALLNKFIGASAIMSGVEAMMPTKQTKSQRTVERSSVNSNKQVKSGRVTQTIKTGSSSSPVGPRICDIEEIWDEETLKKLLEQAKNYEERRKIRARLRQLMAEREAHATSAKSNAADGNDTDVVMTTTKVTTRTVSQTSSVPVSVPVPVSPFTKFKQLDRQSSQHSPKMSK